MQILHFLGTLDLNLAYPQGLLSHHMRVIFVKHGSHFVFQSCLGKKKVLSSKQTLVLPSTKNMYQAEQNMLYSMQILHLLCPLDLSLPYPQGPVKFDELAKLFKEENVHLETFIWHKLLGDKWVKLKNNGCVFLMFCLHFLDACVVGCMHLVQIHCFLMEHIGIWQIYLNTSFFDV